MTRSRLVLPVLLGLVAWLGPAGVAGAQDPQASATISLADGPRAAHGAHRMTVSWSAACASAGPSVRPELGIDIMVVPKRAGAKPISTVSDQPAAAAGSEVMTVAAGARVFARIRNECTRVEFVTPGPDGEDTILHTDRATARSAGTISVAPWIGHARLVGCGRLRLKSQWVVASFLPRATPDAVLRAVRIRVRGAGLGGDVRPAKVSQTLGEPIEAAIAPRRTGRLRVSVSFAGVRSNTVSVRVRRVC